MCRCNDKKQTMSPKPLAAASVILLLTLILVFGGCAVGPDFVKPETKVNENWSQKDNPQIATQSAVDSQWWKTFNDPKLDQLIQMAYQQNLPLQVAGLRILESRARLGIAVGGQYPQMEVNGSAGKVGISDNMPNGARSDRDYWDYQTGFDASWELDFWGKYRRDIESAQASLVATMAEYDNALVTLTGEVARTYTLIRTYEVLIDLANENTKLQEEGLRIAKARFDNGATSELDVTQATTLLESTRASIPKLQASLQQAQNALNTLLGQATGDIKTAMEGSRVIPAAQSKVGVSVPAELLRRRPDIRSAELIAMAQCARIGVAKADLYPSFSLFGQVGFNTSSDGGIQSNDAEFHNLFDGDSFTYSFGPGFNWPIFNFGRIENNVRVQDAKFQQLLINYQNTVLKAAQEVEDSMTGFLRAQEATAFDQNAVNAAKRSAEIAMTQYKEGAVDYQRVIDVQRSLLQEQNSLAQTQSSIATNLIALYKALGGGWELRQGQPIVPESMQTEMQKRTNWGKLLPSKPAPETLADPTPAGKMPLQTVDW
jgi:NodT family efflux transporter outer membrane factor (OMF) lipoprotein